MKLPFEYTDEEYRAKAFLSNSDLSELYRWLTNTKFTASPKALWFGSMFHKMILEPRKVTPTDFDDFSDDETHALLDCQNAVLNTSGIPEMLSLGRTELIRFWEDKETSISCKCKLDYTDNNRTHIVDFKTTQAKTESEFYNECFVFEYNRQGAFYLDSHPLARTFELIGVQKVYPYAVYRLPFYKDSDFIEKGRKRMRYLMQYAQQQLNKPDGWRPSSWQMIIPEQQ